jgi:signal transduction histidine kinase
LALVQQVVDSSAIELRLTLPILPVEPWMRSEAPKPDRTDNFSDPAFAQSYLAAIVESSDDAIISKNLDGIIQSCNAAARRLFGYTASELTGQSVRILIPPDRQAEEDEILARIRERQLDTTIGPMAGDPARLQQVVWNLLSNALKFTPKAGRVRVILRRAGSQAEIVVEDDGAGIRPDFLPHVFDRFQQADVSRARRFGGLGLGL